MDWQVEFYSAFAQEVEALQRPVRVQLSAHINLLRLHGPALRRPYADTLKGSKYANMKELRFDAFGGAWRVAYAFDPERKAILLVAGDKSGVAQPRFYRSLIRRADARFEEHLKQLARRE
jgi:hypothetical protein